MSGALLWMSLIAGTFSLFDGESSQSVTIELRHPLRRVEAVTHAVEGAADLTDGVLRAHLRARVDSFHSGNSSCDEYMLEALDASLHPYVEVRLEVPTRGWPVSGDISIPARVTMNGVSRVLLVAIHLIPRSVTRTTASGSFTVDMADFGVAPPAYLLLSVDRMVGIRFNLDTVLTSHQENLTRAEAVR
jgi:hypothetical protein